MTEHPGGRPADDVVQPFQIEGPGLRGRLVRLGPAIDTVLKREMRIANGLQELSADYRQRIDRERTALIAADSLLHAGIACHRVAWSGLACFHLPAGLLGEHI